MDAMELARRDAASLHDDLVAGGADPWNPLELATAAAKRFGYEVEGTACGAAVLDGSRATVDPADKTIYFEDVGTDFDKAFLIGHEVGHVALGDIKHDVGHCEFDAGRASEAAPIGIDRIVDYSPHQRREVQMDLYSRELMLPRPRARTLHVDEAMTAEQIAARLKAPYNVVAQQLLDALLLPRIPEPERPKQPPELNKKQRDAAGHFGKPFLLEAGPGTGKTQTLTARVEKLLQRNVDPKRILVLTFSNKAAGEMVERIARNDPEAAALMWMGTFHACGLELVRQFHEELGLPKDPRLLDKVEATELLEREFARLKLTHYRNLYDPTRIIIEILSAISRAKDEVADVARYRECGEAMLRAAQEPEQVKAAEQALEVADVYEAYERVKGKAGAVDFGDLVMLPVNLLESNEAIRTSVQARYDHVLVDEFQDVNRASVRLLQAVTGRGAELWAVGDARQSIYRFRGASAYNVARFGKEDFPGGERDRLEINYRSVDEVVATFTKFSETMSGLGGDTQLRADRGPSGIKPELRLVEKNGLQSPAIADAIEELHVAGIQYRDQAVLCTGNERLTAIARELERMEIPVLFLGSLFERPEIKDLLSLISLTVDPRAMGLVRTSTMAEFEMSMADVMMALRQYRADERKEPGVPPPPAGISADGAKAFEKLAAALKGCAESSSPWLVLTRMLLDRTRMAARIASSQSVSERARGIAIWQLMNFVAAQPPGGAGFPIKRLLDRIRRLVRLSEDRDLRQMPAAAQGLDAVRLMTVHGSKGLEFKAVHLPGLNINTLPRPSQRPACPPPDGLIEGATEDGLTAFRQGHDSEQECLFYVAMSRARDRLIMPVAKAKANGHRWSLSPFVDRLGGTIERIDVTPSQVLADDPDSAPIELALAGPLRFSPSQIALYERCPRRFFYTHMLRVGGKRVSTAFMSMHEAVQEVVVRLVKQTVPADDAGLHAEIEQACRRAGLEEDALFGDYVALAISLVEYFRQTRTGMQVRECIDLKLAVDGHEISFRPDDVVVDGDGIIHFRKVRTGHATQAEKKDIGATALQLAVADESIEAIVELIHLSDGEVTQLSASRGDSGRGKLSTTFASIAAGAFPTDPSPRQCPGCPAFFICGPVPAGKFEKII